MDMPDEDAPTADVSVEAVVVAIDARRADVVSRSPRRDGRTNGAMETTASLHHSRTHARLIATYRNWGLFSSTLMPKGASRLAMNGYYR